MTIFTTTFIADASGNSLKFECPSIPGVVTVENISLKEVTSPATIENITVKEFLTGNDDEGKEIFFRADTQELQFSNDFEIFSNPIAVITKLQRGTLVKCFVSLDGGDYYEIQGTVTKGVSILKVHSKDIKAIPTPPISRNIRLSWRDSSKQLCRLLQTAIIFIPGTMDYSE